MNYEEILEKIKEKFNVPSDFAYQHTQCEVSGIGTMQEIEQKGGEDEGSSWYAIKYFLDHDIYIKISGWYSSYEGTEFTDWDECCKQVVPQEKLVTVFEAL